MFPVEDQLFDRLAGAKCALVSIYPQAHVAEPCTAGRLNELGAWFGLQL
jgi:hypothetical protein